MSVGKFFEGTTLIVSFEGWNDAGESASSAVKFLIDKTAAEPISEIDSQSFYDYQFARPQVFFDENKARKLRWPTTVFFKPKDAAFSDLIFLVGMEPARNWLEFSKLVLEIAEDQEVDSVIFVGSMLADAPHTRPIQVTATSTNQDVLELVDAEKSTYEGPVGILTVLSMEFEETGIPTMSLWAAVPHYVHNGPVPKATLALVTAIEAHLGFSIDHGNLPDEAFKWERAVDELAEADEDLAEYVAGLESARDESEQTNGDALAREVEQFLRQAEDEKD